MECCMSSQTHEFEDAYRDAKANSFNVSVVKKGQLQLNVDQSLEEVEEAITDIGSKIYHDKIMRERSLDVTTVMKGLFGTGKPTKKRCWTGHKRQILLWFLQCCTKTACKFYIRSYSCLLSFRSKYFPTQP